jgi:hypothetical protein
MNEAVDGFEFASVKANLQVGLRPSSRGDWAMKSPDVIATSFQNTTLFEPQTHTAASWLSARCKAQLENLHDQIRLDARHENQIIQELKAAGFQVLKQRI